MAAERHKACRMMFEVTISELIKGADRLDSVSARLEALSCRVEEAVGGYIPEGEEGAAVRQSLRMQAEDLRINSVRIKNYGAVLKQCARLYGQADAAASAYRDPVAAPVVVAKDISLREINGYLDKYGSIRY